MIVSTLTTQPVIFHDRVSWSSNQNLIAEINEIWRDHT